MLKGYRVPEADVPATPPAEPKSTWGWKAAVGAALVAGAAYIASRVLKLA